MEKRELRQKIANSTAKLNAISERVLELTDIDKFEILYKELDAIIESIKKVSSECAQKEALDREPIPFNTHPDPNCTILPGF